MKSILLGTALTAALFAGAASASPVHVDFQSDGLFGSGNLYQSVYIDTVGGHTGNVSAGMFHMTGDNGIGDFLSFCVDLGDYLYNHTDYNTSDDLMTGSILSNIGKLFSTALGGATMEAAIDTSTKAAGFQIALWEIISDTGAAFNLSAGNFKASGNGLATTQANTYLSAVTPGAADDAYDFTFYAHDTRQDVLTATPVPLPASGLLLAFGISGLFAARRRRRNVS